MDLALQRYGPQLTQSQLPTDTVLQGDTVSTVINGDETTLQICLTLAPDHRAYTVTKWAQQAQWQQDTGMNLWQTG